jgi:hypothetical protein
VTITGAPEFAGARLPGATVNIRALLIAIAASLLAAVSIAAPPLASSWNITPSGSAASSGQLLFRVTPAGGAPVEVTVAVPRGSSDVIVARTIRQALSSQLPHIYRVELGEGANVLLADARGKPTLSIELLNSDVDGMRVSVRNIQAAATPTVPAQTEPATPPPAPTPAQPGAASPPTQDPQDALPPADALPAPSTNPPADFPGPPAGTPLEPAQPPGSPPTPSPAPSSPTPPDAAPAGSGANAPPPAR